jgi:hypothetical protein
MCLLLEADFCASEQKWHGASQEKFTSHETTGTELKRRLLCS